MQDFVRLHMMSMLQPFATRVHELQSQVQLLAEAQHGTSTTLEEQVEKLASQEEQLAAVQADAEKAAEQIEKVAAEVGNVKKERNRLEGNHEITKASLAKVKDSCTSAHDVLEELRQSLEANGIRLSGMETSVVDAEKRLIERFDTRLDKQGKTCKELNEKQAELQKICHQAKSVSERANAAVNKLSSLQESFQAEDVENFAGLRESTADLQSRLAKMEDEHQLQVKGLASTDREVQHLKTWTEQLQDVQQLQTLQAQTRSAIQAQELRLSSAEAQLAELQVRPDDKGEQQRKDLQAVELRLSKALADVEKFRDGVNTQAELLCTANRRLQDLEKDQTSLQQQASATREELQEVHSKQQANEDGLQSQRTQIHAACSDISGVQERIAGVARELQGVQGDQGSMRESLAKLGSRLDLCHKYFNGLGKGLQDAHRQIVGNEGGMLQPKMGGETPSLPALAPLPRAPRTPRKTLPSPRNAAGLTK